VAKQSRLLILIPSLAVIVGIAFFMILPSQAEHEVVEFSIDTIMIDNIELTVQIADTEHRRADGLMFQEELPYDEGMLFVFDDSKKRTFWMSNMLFSLDIIWIDSQGKIVHIEKNVPPCDTTETETCPLYDGGGKDSKYILEVTAGFVDEYKITEDSKLEITF
jgi:uncharacterized protein